MGEKPRSDAMGFILKPPSGEFTIRKIYVKDVSFETPISPAIFTLEWSPEVDVNLRTTVVLLEPGEYEITLTVTATVTVGEHTAYLVEVHQAGIFRIIGLTQDELDTAVSAYCPSILYPYARELVSALVLRGGFPQFVLSPVNFDALYEQQRGAQADAASSAAAALDSDDR